MLPEYQVDPRRRLLPDLDGKYSLQIQTTTACNAACVFCPHAVSWGRGPVQLMPEKLFETIISEMKAFRFYKIAPYLQSEPLCDPRIGDFIKVISRELNFDLIEIATNPMALQEKNRQLLADSLKDIPHDIRISFQGVDRASYEGNCGLEYEKSLSHVIALLHLAPEAGLNVTIKALGYRRGDVRCAAHEYDETDFLRHWTDVCQKEGLSPDDYHFKYGAFHNRSDNVHREGEQARAIVRPSLQCFYCTRVDKWFHIVHSGEMILCCNDYFKEVVLGDLAETRLADIWGSENHRRIIAQVRGESPSAADFLCKRCTSPGG